MKDLPYEELSEALLKWHDKQGRHLPWRQTDDPYRIWTAEVILQQTQIRQAETYLTRFWAVFPTVEALAWAPIETLLAVWQGLGYYQRAHNLHRAAQRLLEYMPLEPWEKALPYWESLPGVGAYTARAVLAFAGGAPLLPVDGNVVRILSRLRAESVPAANRRYYQHLADALPPAFKGRSVAFALMDLAQLLCRPQRPSCLLCPLSTHCQASASGHPAHFPPSSPRPERPLRAYKFLLYYTHEAVWLQQRPLRGLWGGLWCLPMLPLAQPAGTPSLFHDFTHFRLAGYVEATEKPPPATEPVPWKTLAAYGLPAPIRRYLESIPSEIEWQPGHPPAGDTTLPPNPK